MLSPPTDSMIEASCLDLWIKKFPKIKAIIKKQTEEIEKRVIPEVLIESDRLLVIPDPKKLPIDPPAAITP